jgi:hypothetical protein
MAQQLLKTSNSLSGVNLNEMIVLVAIVGAMLFILWCVSCVVGRCKAADQRRVLEAATAAAARQQQELRGWQSMDGGGIFGFSGEGNN